MPEETTPLDEFFDNLDRESRSSEFGDIDEGVYRLELTGHGELKRDRNGCLRSQLELTITGERDEGNSLNLIEESTFNRRKVWDNVALEGEQFNYLMSGIISAFAKRNPDKRAALASVPFYKQEIPEDEEYQWDNYLNACEGLDFIAVLKPYKSMYNNVERTKYRINPVKDQAE